MAKIVTDEEEMVHNGEALPILSASAKKMNIDKLLNTPLPTYDSSVPGSISGPKLPSGCVAVSSAQFRTTASSSTTELQVGGAGAMCCG